MLVIVVELVLVCVAVFLIDGPSLIRRRRWREFLVYMGIYLTTVAFSFYWGIVRPPVALNRHIMRVLEPIATRILGPPGTQ
ncbi:MAG: hypothetical protein ACM3X3_01285 [Betaproteobacteria bacterium]